MADDPELSRREKLAALESVLRFQPTFSAGLILLGGIAAVFEGVGLGFIYPIIQITRSGDPVNPDGPVLTAFLSVYEFLGLPFSLEYLILGVTAVMTARYTMSFVVGWLRAILSMKYEKHLRSEGFERALGARIEYFDREGSDDILNAIITETRYSGRAITRAVQTMEYAFLVLVYLGVMLYIAPFMTALAMILLGGITLLIRFVIEPAVTIGDRVAEANERVQQFVQTGTQGIRDVKLFGLTEEVFSSFGNSIDRYAESEVRLRRNETGITNFYQLAAAIIIFVLIYVGFEFTGLSFGELGIFLIAMFQLSPRVSRLNNYVYSLEGLLSHLVRTQEFLDELTEYEESGGTRPVDSIARIEFKDVQFSYGDEDVLNGLSFEANRNEFIAFVGQSGAGKSTIVSLLARMYTPDDGEIRADGIPIEEYDLRKWRDRIAVVRQNPFIFDDTLAANITIGNRDADRSDIERVCEIAKVDEFLDDLPDGLDSQLGDEGTRLSGGQRQRVALARALLKDADFLILDEATSDLDSNLESEVQRAIESMDRDYGIVAIAHRLSTVKNADRIHTVENGRIVESGTHETLLAEDNEYAQLYAIQAKE